MFLYSDVFNCPFLSFLKYSQRKYVPITLVSINVKLSRDKGPQQKGSLRMTVRKMNRFLARSEKINGNSILLQLNP